MVDTARVGADDFAVVLVLGAGGRDGGRFIDGALAELATSIGFRPTHSRAVIGTSIGAFRAAEIGAAVDLPPSVAAALRSMARDRPTPMPLDPPAHRLRLWLGRVAARVVPRSRPSPRWSTPPSPHHGGAAVVSVDLDHRRRSVHRLAELADPAGVIRASAAVPFAVGPVVLSGRPHGDGALWSPTSADLAAEFDPTTVIVIAPMVPDIGGSPLERLHRRQLRAELAELGPSTSVILICPGPGRRSTVRTERAGAAAVRAVRNGGSTLARRRKPSA